MANMCAYFMAFSPIRKSCGMFKADALDMQGSPCADATRKLDLCDSCLYKVGKAIDSALAPPLASEAKDTQ